MWLPISLHTVYNHTLKVDQLSFPNVQPINYACMHNIAWYTRLKVVVRMIFS